MTVDAVVFDIGNVLIEWQPERFYDRVVGETRRKQMFAAIDLHAMNDRVDRGEVWRDVIEETAHAHPDFASDIMIWHDRWIEMAAPAIGHSVRLLRALRSRGIPVFSLTNFGRETFEVARVEYPFLEEFDRSYISGHLEVIKPDEGIYAAVEADCGYPASGLLFTDDRAENIDAAAARGWQTHKFEGSEGWAERLVHEGLLNREEAR